MCACEIPPGNDATYCNPDQPATVPTAAEYVDGLEDLTRAKKEDFSPERKRTGTTGPLPVITIDGASNDRPTSGAGQPAGKAVDLAMCEAAADAIDKACNQGWGGMGTNKEAIFEILKDKTLAERQKIDEFFRTKYGKNYGKAKNGSDWGLEEEIKDELDGADRQKALDLLIRKDGSADRAGHIHEVLMEKDQWFEGRSKEMCEKDLRDTLATMNSDQLAQLDNEYRTRHGKGLFDTLKDDPKLSEPTKQALAIYAQGADKLKLNTADQLKLADIAIKAKNIEMFQEAMRDASPEARKPFTGDSGEETLKKAFGHAGRVNGKTVYEETTELQHACDYVKNGKLSTATLIGENNSWAGDNERAIEKALHDLKPEERRDYVRGRWLASNISDESKLGESDRRALASYREIHAALEKAGNSVELARWEDMIARKDGSLVAKLAGHRGSIYDDSLGDVLADIESMSRKDWDRLRADKNYRDEIEGCLKTYLSDSDVKKCMDLIDQKKNARPLDEAVIKTMSGMKPEERESFIRGRELFEKKAEMSTLSLVDQTALLSYTKIQTDLSFAAATSEGRRGVLDAIDDASGTFEDTEENVYDAIKNMSHEEQLKYRNDPLFKSKVDEMVRDVLDEGPEQDAAFRMLKQIENEQSPSEDLVVKVLQHAGKGDEAAVVRDVLKAFRDSENKGEKPTLFERINNPDQKHLADRALADDFKDALRKTLEAKHADKLIQNGFLSLEDQMEFCKSVKGDDEQNAYADLAALGAVANKYPRSPAEAEADAHAKARVEGNEKADPAAVEAARARAQQEIDAFELRAQNGDTTAIIIKNAHDEAQKLLTNQKYQDDVLHFMSQEERQVALYALKQGEMRTEDKVRSHMVGGGTGEEEIKQELSRLSPMEKEQLRRDFAEKYKTDLTYEFIDELGGLDKTEALRSARREAASAEEAFDRSRAEYYESRDGFGGTWVDEMWDSTGYQADEAMSVYRSAMTEFAAKFEQMPPEKQQEFMQNLQQSLEMFVESKGALGDGLTDAGIAAGCVVAGFVTKGSTWVLLGALISGGFFKAGVKGAIMGSDYDWGSSAALVDFGAGGVDAALNLVTFGAGSSAAKGVLATGGKELLKKSSEEALEKGLIKIVKESVKSSSKEISEEAVEKLVLDLAREGATDAERAALRKSITENLDTAIKEEADHFLKKVGRDILHGTKPGIVGGGGSGGFRALAQWDDTRSFEENMAMVGKMAGTSAAIGAAGAIATTMVFSVGGRGYHALKQRYDLKPGQPPSPAQLKEMEQAIARDAGGAEVKVNTDANGDIVAIVRSNRRPVDTPKTGSGGAGKLPEEVFGSNPPADSPTSEKATDRTPPASDRQQPERIAPDESRQGQPSADQPVQPTSKTRELPLGEDDMIGVGLDEFADSPFASQLNREQVVMERSNGKVRVMPNAEQPVYLIKQPGDKPILLDRRKPTVVEPGAELRLSAEDGPAIKVRENDVQLSPGEGVPAPTKSGPAPVKLEFEVDNNILPVGRQQLKDSPFGSQLDDQHVHLTKKKDGTLRVRGNSKQETYFFDASTGETTPFYLNDVKNFNKGDKIHLGAKDGPTIQIGEDGHPYLSDGTGTPRKTGAREITPQVRPGTSVPDVELQLGKFKGRIAPGQEIDLGRYDLDNPKRHMEVSRKHMRVGRDEAGNLYVVDNNKPTKTLIERGKNQFIELKPGERTVLEPGDVLRMGDKDGPPLAISAETPSASPHVEQRVDGARLPDTGARHDIAHHSAPPELHGKPIVRDSTPAPVRIERGAGGEVLGTTDALGRTTRYEYDADGLSKVILPDGRVATKQAPGEWTVSYPNAPDIPQPWKAKFGMDAQNGVLWMTNGDADLVIVQPDGSQQVKRLEGFPRDWTEGPNGPVPVKQGRVVTTYEYGPNGKLTKMHGTDGFSARPLEPGKWEVTEGSHTYTFDGDMTVRSRGRYVQEFYGEPRRTVSVDPYGDRDTRFADGSNFAHRADGRLKSARDDFGRGADFRWTEEGRLWQVVTSESKLTSEDGLNWVETTFPDGKEIRKFSGSVELHDNGTYSIRPDGKQPELRGAPVVRDTPPAQVKVERGAGDSVISTTDALGRTTRYEHDGDGLKKVIFPDGRVAARDATGEWTISLPNEPHITERWKGKFGMDSETGVLWMTQDDDLVTVSPDGSRQVKRIQGYPRKWADGPAGQMPTPQNSGQVVTTYEYGTHGNLIGMHGTDGFSARPVEPGRWEVTDGSHTYTFDGEMSMPSSGRYTQKFDGEPKRVVVVDAHGRKHTTYPDRSQSHHGPDGRLRSIMDRNGDITEFRWTDQGQLLEVLNPPTKLSSKDGRNWTETTYPEGKEIRTLTGAVEVHQDGTYSIRKDVPPAT